MALLAYLLLRRLSGQHDGQAQIAFRVVVNRQAMVFSLNPPRIGVPAVSPRERDLVLTPKPPKKMSVAAC